MNDQGGPADQVTPVCAIGTSAGGVEALQKFFQLLPTDLGLAYVVILHLAPDQPSALGEILSNRTRMPVVQVTSSAVLRRDAVFVIPPDRELVINGEQLIARPFGEPRGRRVPIDVFFRSIAAGRGDGIAVVLTGSGSDGAVGVRAIKEGGGVVFVQDPAEAGFAGMPQNAIATGDADFVAPLASLVERLIEVARSKEAVRSLDVEDAANDLRRIIAFLRARTGHDFSSYKRATVLRRVTRRLQVCRVPSLGAYIEYLVKTPEEAHELFSDLLISVTRFFRDAAAFDALQRKVIEPLFEHPADEGLRAWVVGCATGEEAYSIAILMLEEAAKRNVQPVIQIFATDLDEGALATARTARYPRSIVADVSEERLQQYFIDDGTHYRIRKEVRDCVLFTTHSVLKDPPFMRLDLISCRNLLIYVDRALQQQLCRTFHYGLRPNAFLFLGPAETADGTPDLFTTLDKEARLYRAKPQASRVAPALPYFSHSPHVAMPLRPDMLNGARAVQSSSLEAHTTALEKTAPPSALVDSQQDILHLSPTAGRFLFHSAGTFARRLPVVVRPELRLDLKLALDHAFERHVATITHPIVTDFDGEFRRVAMQVVPVTAAQALVFFLDGGVTEAPTEPAFEGEVKPDEFRRLHAELKAAQEALVESRHEHEQSIQDLRAANEELQSVNEEYRSTAEELETSKEELQSANEELQTVNAELKSKLDSVAAAHSDLQNLTVSTEIGTLFLDRELRIKMFTPPVAELFNVTEHDIGRMLSDFTHRLDYDGIEKDVLGVMRDLLPRENEVRSKNGRWFMVRLRPYRTVENRIEGAVVTFVDISARVEAERALAESERRLSALVKASSQVLFVLSPTWEEMRELSGGGIVPEMREPTRDWLAKYVYFDDQAGAKTAIDRAIATRSVFELEHRVQRLDGSIGWMLSRAVPIVDDKGAIMEWFGAATDITDAHRAAEQNQTLLSELQHRVRNVLAVVSAIVSRTGASAATVQEYRDNLMGRIGAFARTQSLLTNARGRPDLETLIKSELMPHVGGDRKLLLSGPPVLLHPQSAEVLALAIHELTTNAIKYGALSSAKGKVDVSWHTYDQEGKTWLRLEWQEDGVTGATPEKPAGFGTELVTRRIPYELRGKADLEMTERGIRCVIEFPLEEGKSVLETGAPAQTQ
jgi:two-component system CheB/CheR fusion protein